MLNGQINDKHPRKQLQNSRCYTPDQVRGMKYHQSRLISRKVLKKMPIQGSNVEMTLLVISGPYSCVPLLSNFFPASSSLAI